MDTEKGFDKIQHPFIRTVQQVDIEGTHLNSIKAILTNPQQMSSSMAKIESISYFLRNEKMVPTLTTTI